MVVSGRHDGVPASQFMAAWIGADRYGQCSIMAAGRAGTLTLLGLTATVLRCVVVPRIQYKFHLDTIPLSLVVFLPTAHS